MKRWLDAMFLVALVFFILVGCSGVAPMSKNWETLTRSLSFTQFLPMANEVVR